jgi:hypothetical protein
MNKMIIATATVLALNGAAFAQNASSPSTSSQAQVSPNTSSAAVDRAVLTGNWRASKLMGMAVYNQANEKLGDVNELIVDPAGKVSAVVIGVGGFLGLGEHDVAVSMSQLAVTDNGRQVSANNNASSTVGTVSNSRPAPSQSANTNDWVPERLVLNTTKEQLKSMKQFKYSD